MKTRCMNGAALAATLAVAVVLSSLSPARAFAERVVGIGVQIGQDAHLQTEIRSVIPNLPAQRAGIRAGDLLLAVDGNRTTGLSIDAVASLLRGAGIEGSLVTLDVYSPTRRQGRIFQLQRQAFGDDCLLEGSLNLRLQGSPENGWVSGSIGTQYVNWSVFYGRIQAWVGQRMTTLDISRMPYGSDIEISGWIGGSYVRWRSMGDWFTGYQPCIRP